MEEENCSNCAFRKKFDDNPGSFLGKLWRWHASWCPGWKKYMSSLPETERIDLAKRYHMQKYLM